MPRLFAAVLLLVLTLCLPLRAAIPVRGGCVLGESQAAHGLAPAEAEARIRRYARLYVQSYKAYKREEVDVRRKTNAFMELDGWTQEDIINFTRQQRELLYISIAGELAVGKIGTDELPGYVIAIDRKIQEIETELGCELLPEESR